MSSVSKPDTIQEKNRLYYGDNLQVLRDYRLSASESARIQCTAFAIGGSVFSSCPEPATFGQNRGSAPFWYHCDLHAALLRDTGSVWPKGQPAILAKSDAY